MGWAWLPDLALALIIHKLLCLPDCVRFASVCSTWRSAAKSAAKHDNKQFHVPMLLLPTTSIDAGEIPTLDLYSFAENRIYTVPFPFLLHHNTKFYGFSHGWLAIVEADFSVTFLRPSPKSSTAQNDVVRLSPIRCHTDLPIYKITLSGDPNTSNPYFVTVIFDKLKKWIIFNSGNQDWCYPFWTNLDDYAETRHHFIVRVLSSANDFLTGRAVSVVVRCLARSWIYITRSSRGEAMLIEFCLSFVKVVELDLPRAGEEREDVGGDALFLGKNCNVTVAASDVVDVLRCKKDCLYYVDDAYNVCVLPLETGQSETLYHLNYQPSNPSSYDHMPPIWITPTLSNDWI